MADDAKPYELEGGTEAYLRNVKRMEEAWWNHPGTDKTWVEATIRRFDDLSLSRWPASHFDEVWDERRTFQIEGVEVPVARLAHIVESKRRCAPALLEREKL